MKSPTNIIDGKLAKNVTIQWSTQPFYSSERYWSYPYAIALPNSDKCWLPIGWFYFCFHLIVVLILDFGCGYFYLFRMLGYGLLMEQHISFSCATPFFFISKFYYRIILLICNYSIEFETWSSTHFNKFYNDQFCCFEVVSKLWACLKCPSKLSSFRK